MMNVKNYVIKQAKLVNGKRIDILVENGIIKEVAPHKMCIRDRY